MSSEEVELSELTAVSPLDGRYWRVTRALSAHCSELALVRARVRVEIEYFLALARSAAVRSAVPALAAFDVAAHEPALRALYADFDAAACARVKALERATNHDVKAVEYYLREKFVELGGALAPLREWLHFALTSQDVNNTAVPLLLHSAMDSVWLVALDRLRGTLRARGEALLGEPMLARTHGQPATPTRVGKELLVFAERLAAQRRLLCAVPRQAKFGGATGTLAAHHVALPAVDWCALADDVCARLGLERQQYTTQIEHYDMLGALFDAVARINTVLLDLARDMWQYISLGYFTQRVVANEVGSSAMPHKVNPIDFENAEGNIGIANALLRHLAEKLPVSRLQRDLSDSTVLRNVGVPLAHSLIAIESLSRGFGKVSLDRDAVRRDLDNNWQVISEAVQTILRREGYDAPYDALKKLTRGASAADAKERMRAFVEQLDVSDAVRDELRALAPHTFIGVVPDVAHVLGKADGDSNA